MPIDWTKPIKHRNGIPCGHDFKDEKLGLHIVRRPTTGVADWLITMADDNGIAVPADPQWDVLQA